MGFDVLAGKVWGRTDGKGISPAKSISNNCYKGRPILVDGYLSLDKWNDKDTGDLVERLRVVVDTYEFVDKKDKSKVTTVDVSDCSGSCGDSCSDAEPCCAGASTEKEYKSFDAIAGDPIESESK